MYANCPPFSHPKASDGSIDEIASKTVTKLVNKGRDIVQKQFEELFNGVGRVALWRLVSLGKLVHGKGAVDLNKYPQEFTALFFEALIPRVWQRIPEFQQNDDDTNAHSHPFIL